MNKYEIAETLQKSTNENGLVPTLSEIFGKNIKVRLPFYQKGCATDIDDLDFSVRSSNSMKRAGIMTVGQAVDALLDGRMKTIRNLGRKSYIEIQTKIMQFGYDNLPENEKKRFFIDLVERNCR
jgi:DNA-directed RNA polymerase alpha subunit